jgi:anti-sigma factor RsiW
MIDHAEMTLMMSLALDGMLSPEEQGAFEAHLRTCPDCQARWTRWRQVDALLAAGPVLSPSPGFSARVLKRLRRRGQHQQRLLGGVLLLGGSLSVWGMVLLALVTAALLWTVSDPSVAIHGAQVLSHLLEYGQPFGVAVVGGLCLCGVGDDSGVGSVGAATPTASPGLDARDVVLCA